ncbi:MAG: hypothetical protein ACK4WH_12230 [Phycisphaerales bacterium]
MDVSHDLPIKVQTRSGEESTTGSLARDIFRISQWFAGQVLTDDVNSVARRERTSRNFCACKSLRSEQRPQGTTNPQKEVSSKEAQSTDFALTVATIAVSSLPEKPLR